MLAKTKTDREALVYPHPEPPAAGQVLEVAPASEDEISAELGRLATPDAPPEPLISAGRLLRGPPRGYESASHPTPLGRPRGGGGRN